MAERFFALTNLRALSGYSFSELSGQTAKDGKKPITRNYLCHIESGTRRPFDSTLKRLAAALSQSERLKKMYPENTEGCLYKQLKDCVDGR